MIDFIGNDFPKAIDSFGFYQVHRIQSEPMRAQRCNIISSFDLCVLIKLGKWKTYWRFCKCQWLFRIYIGRCILEWKRYGGGVMIGLCYCWISFEIDWRDSKIGWSVLTKKKFYPISTGRNFCSTWLVFYTFYWCRKSDFWAEFLRFDVKDLCEDFLRENLFR